MSANVLPAVCPRLPNKPLGQIQIKPVWIEELVIISTCIILVQEDASNTQGSC
jgi:hypothetical protein